MDHKCIAIEKIGKLLNEASIDDKVIIDENQSINEIYDIIIQYVMKYKEVLKFNAVNFIDKLQSYKYKYELHMWLDNDINKKELSNILKNKYFTKMGQYILYSKPIILKYIIYNDNIYDVSQGNYFVTNVKFLINYKLHGITCIGNHPNLNPYTYGFCIDKRISNLDFNEENINKAIKSFEYCNLNICYDKKKFTNEFKEIIK